MVSRIRIFISNKLIDLKKAYKQYQFIFIGALICLIIGLIAGIGIADSSTERYANNMLVTSIVNGKFNIFLFYIQVLSLSSILFAICFLLSFNYYAFLLNGAALIIFLRYYFAYIFASCLLEGLVAYILLITLWLPLIIILMAFYIKYFISMYSLIFSCNRKLIVSYASYWPTTRKMFLNTILYLYLVLIIYTGIFLIILNLIY